MMRYAAHLLTESLVMSALILLYLILSRLFMKEFRAKLRYAVWVILLVGLLLPMSHLVNDGFITIPLPAEAQTRFNVSEGAANVTADITYAGHENPAPGNDGYSPAGRPVSPFALFVVVWGMGAAMLMSYHFWRYYRFIRFICRFGKPIEDEHTLSVFRSVQESKGLSGKKIKLIVSDNVSTSLLTGFLRPMIILPNKHFEADELELIFRHELVHYKRGDMFVKLFSVIALSLHWYNPLVYLMYKALSTDAEASCDESVLRDADAESKQFYAELMLKMIGSKENVTTILSTCYYTGKRGAKIRLSSVLSAKKIVAGPIFTAIIACVTLTVLLSSAFAFAFNDAEEPLQPLNTAESNTIINREQAKEIAVMLIGGGVAARAETKFDIDGVITHYKVIAVFDGNRYDIDINAHDGDLLNMKMDRITTIDANVTDTTGALGADKAKAIAEESVGGGIVTQCRLELKPLDNIFVYHVHVADGEYEFCVEIDARTGALNHETDMRHKP